MSDIGIWGPNQKIIVKAGTNRVSVVRSGPQGPPGAPGPPGASGEGAVFEFTQVIPSVSWVIDHNLGVEPIYNVIEEGTGDSLWPAERHHTINQLELMFLTPRAGTARLRS